ncbi:UDP-glycosyltransferase 85C2-like protein [Tanacetum coccineum]
MAAAPKTEKKPHVVFMPYPAQSHIKATLKLAEVLHHKGLQITFINTEFNHKRFVESGGQHCLDGSPGFQFRIISDGRSSINDVAHTVHQLCYSAETSFLVPFLDLVTKLPTPPTCIISDGFMSAFTIDAAQKLGIPVMLYWVFAAYTSNSTLERSVDWIPGMKGIRLKDLPSMVRTTNPNGMLFKFIVEAAKRSNEVSYNIIHTFDELEATIVDALSLMFSRVYTVGPLQLLLDQIPEEEKQTERSNINRYSLWKEEPECLQWLESKKPNSVVYVNFGSSTVMSIEDLKEFGWGLANSNHYFLWIIRSNMVVGESPVLPPEFEEHIKNRGFIGSWCSQEKVLNHPSVGGFLTHGGWGSTIESLSAGVPMICWPFIADQTTDCRYICNEWGVGLEMGNNVRRDDVEKLVMELMGEIGHKLRKRAMEWKVKARAATSADGSSSLNVDKLANEITMLSRN